MVFVNSKKFACESCIKGHRSSSCHHTDRPLFEIKKKGRPVSQCEKCRELRQSKKFHSKCTCNPTEVVEKPLPVLSSSGTKSRFVPIAPALPNGIKDLYPASTSTNAAAAVADARQRVESLLNPCNCKSVWKCKCRLSNNATGTLSSSHSHETQHTGLATLALAASMCCGGGDTSSNNQDTHEPTIALPPPPHEIEIEIAIHAPSPQDSNIPSPAPPMPSSSASKRPTSRPNSPNASSRSSKRRKRSSTSPSRKVISTASANVKGPDLPPILYPPSSSSSLDGHLDSVTSSQPLDNAITMPEFPTMPPMSTIQSLAGSGCTCGVQCACPGCVQHRGVTHASVRRRDCSDGACTTCVDHVGGIALPGSSTSFTTTTTTSGSSSTNSVLDKFFARAAALPAPPTNRKMGLGIDLDPMNIMVYPTSANSDPAHGVAFGLVSLPKLCCGGKCTCPEGKCGCGHSCDGCGEHESDGEKERVREVVVVPVVVEPTPVVIRSCCAGKA